MRVVCCTLLLCMALPALAHERAANKLARVPSPDTGGPLTLDRRATPAARTPRTMRVANPDFELSTTPEWIRAEPLPRDLRSFDAMPQRPPALTAAVDVVPEEADEDRAAPYRWDVRDHLGMDKMPHRRSALDAMITLRVNSAGEATPGMKGGVVGGIWKALSR